ncbi:MAG TPA: hypothetical protein VFS55_06290 [Dokdonella sp.]|nr:hypothetical protein [Dokdonella sp.]
MRTSLYSILCIVIRLGAVLLAVSALGSVLATAMMVRDGRSPIDLSWIAAAFVASLAIACLLWLYPGPLARLCTARSANQVFESPLAPHDLQWIAFAVLGVYFVVDGIVGFVHYEANLLVADALFDREKRIEDFVRNGSYWILRIVFGLALALGARGLSALLRRLRYGNAPVRDDEVRDG